MEKTMKFNTPLLMTSLLAILATPVLFAGDDVGEGSGAPTSGLTPGDDQILTITVPEVSLIDVTNTTAITLVPPTEAGDNFADASSTGLQYDISANVAADGSVATKKIVVTPTGIPAGWRLDVNMSAPTGGSSVNTTDTLTSTNTAQDVVTGITNVAEKNLSIGITVGPESPTVMPSYTTGGRDITLVYTITAG